MVFHVVYREEIANEDDRWLSRDVDLGVLKCFGVTFRQMTAQETGKQLSDGLIEMQSERQR